MKGEYDCWVHMVWSEVVDGCLVVAGGFG
jgi:hypothetical protein